MDSNYLSEYLVKLGFRVDKVQYAQFANQLREATALVNSQSLAIAKRVAEVGGGLVAMFAGIGGAALGIADKVSQADQSYRLLALHMYTSLPVARELKVALDALGQPLENVIWDPELAGRFHQLVKDQQRLTQELGPDFEKNMHTIRDLRFEFTRLGVTIESYLIPMIVNDLAKAFGTNVAGMLEKLRGWNEWLIENMPRIANEIATRMKPVLIDVRDVMRDLWELVKSATSAFTNLVGALSRNRALEGTTLSFQKFADAMQVSIHFLAKLTEGILDAGQIIADITSALADLGSGNLKGVRTELHAASGLFNAYSGAALGASGGGAAGTVVGSIVGGPVGAMVGGPIGAVIGGAAVSAAGLWHTEGIKRLIVMGAKAEKIPPDLALAVARVESNFRQYSRSGHVLTSDKAGSHAMGIFQLQPGTARALGVDPNDPLGNILGGVKYLRELLAKYHGNEKLALEHYYGSPNAAVNQQYAERVMGVQAGVQIGTLTINVPPSNLSPDSVRHSVTRGIQDAQNQKTQQHLNEFSGWGYAGASY